MKNSTIIEAALLLSATYLFVNKPTYLGGFILAVPAILFHCRAIHADKKDQ